MTTQEAERERAQLLREAEVEKAAAAAAAAAAAGLAKKELAAETRRLAAAAQEARGAEKHRLVQEAIAVQERLFLEAHTTTAERERERVLLLQEAAAVAAKHKTVEESNAEPPGGLVQAIENATLDIVDAALQVRGPLFSLSCRSFFGGGSVVVVRWFGWFGGGGSVVRVVRWLG